MGSRSSTSRSSSPGPRMSYGGAASSSVSASTRSFVCRPASVSSRRRRRGRGRAARRRPRPAAPAAGGRPGRTPRGNAVGERLQHVGLGPADALGHQGGDVAVAAVLAEQVGRVPEPGDRFGRAPGSVRSGGVQGPPLRRCAGRGLGDEVGGPGDAGGVGEVAEDPPQRGDAALFAGRDGRLGGDHVPDARDVAGDLAVGEVVEERVDHLGRYRGPGARPVRRSRRPTSCRMPSAMTASVGSSAKYVTTSIGSTSRNRRRAIGSIAATLAPGGERQVVA